MTASVAMEGCWKCTDRPPIADVSRLLCHRCSLLNVGPGSTELTTFGIYQLDTSAGISVPSSSSWTEPAPDKRVLPSREDDDSTMTMGVITTTARRPAAPIRQPEHISPDWILYPPENDSYGGLIEWSSDQVFVSADGYSGVEEAAYFSLPVFGAGHWDPPDYQGISLEDHPSLFIDSPRQLESLDDSHVSPTHQLVLGALGKFEIPSKLHSSFQHKRHSVGSARSASGMSYGQHSLYQALLSLDYASDESTTHSSTTRDFNAGSSTSTQSRPKTGDIVEPVDREDDPEGIETAMCGVLPLDPGVENNYLPFVLQSYANWMKMIMFDPLRVADKTKDYIIRRYVGSTQSRLRMILIANLLRAVIVLDATYKPMLSLLKIEIRQTLVQSKNPSVPVSWDSDDTLFSPLHFTLELNLFSLSGPLLEALQVLTLQVLSDIAPVIRRMCSDPTAQYVHLPSLLAHGDSNVRGYPAIDIMYSMLTGLPTQLKYDANSRLLIDPGTAEPVGTWLIGQPRELTLILARIFSLHDEFGVDVDSRIIEEIESDLKDFRPDPGISVEPSLMVTRLVVLEAWRQVGYINLYMRLCGESALGPRVRVAHRRLMDLFATTKSGLAVNLHLAPCLGIALFRQDLRPPKRTSATWS
ncbi:unnamed protein product [Rhizoctonia solani]|uniref:Uncharacterized protein n=1 Tax=Rhizoctonia solani TaxID=456999 RepID=A0A8H3APF7_9AGAM|nr:unnamed protein product [Rhizoctonia solani]